MGGSTKLMSSGAGGVILTTPGSIAADVTVNLPTQNCTLDIQGPAFSAYLNSTLSLTASVSTKLIFDVEEYDTNNNFASSRFTPTVAGYYALSGAFRNSASSASNQLFVYKNGTLWKEISVCATNANQNATGSCQVYLNGTTDYVEMYGLTTITQNASPGSAYTYFQGVLVRAA